MSNSVYFAKNAGQTYPLSGEGTNTLTDMVPVLYVQLPSNGNYLLFAKGEIFNADSSPQSCQMGIWTEIDASLNNPPGKSTANIIEMAAVALAATNNVGAQTCITLVGKHTVTNTQDSKIVYLGASTPNGKILRYSLWAEQVGDVAGYAFNSVSEILGSTPGYTPPNG